MFDSDKKPTAAKIGEVSAESETLLVEKREPELAALVRCLPESGLAATSARAGTIPDAKRTSHKSNVTRVTLSRSFQIIVALLFIVAILGNRVQVARTEVLQLVSQFQGEKAHVLATKDLIRAYKCAGMTKASSDTAEQLVAGLQSGHEHDDNLLSFARMMLAETKLSEGDLTEAHKYCESALLGLKEPSRNSPDEFSQTAWELANQLAEKNDRKLASELYRCSEKYWTSSASGPGVYSRPGATSTQSTPGHKCYMLMDASLNSEAMGDYEAALGFAREAVDSAAATEHWAETEGQVDRLGKVAFYLNQLKRFDEAESVAGQAMAIATTKLRADNDFAVYAAGQLKHAREMKLLEKR